MPLLLPPCRQWAPGFSSLAVSLCSRACVPRLLVPVLAGPCAGWSLVFIGGSPQRLGLACKVPHRLAQRSHHPPPLRTSGLISLSHHRRDVPPLVYKLSQLHKLLPHSDSNYPSDSILRGPVRYGRLWNLLSRFPAGLCSGPQGLNWSVPCRPVPCSPMRCSRTGPVSFSFL